MKPETDDKAIAARLLDEMCIRDRVTDHHAIIPTPLQTRTALSADERKVYELICRRLLMAWHDEHVWAVTTLITAITTLQADETFIDRYHSSGTAVEQLGWKILEPSADPARKKAGVKRKTEADGDSPAEEEASQSLPPGLTAGQRQRVWDVRAIAKQTRPPPRLTEAALLTAMETAGRQLEDKELSAAMKASGLGTPATRADIIAVSYTHLDVYKRQVDAWY